MTLASLDAEAGSDLDSATMFLPSDRRRQLVAFAHLCRELIEGVAGAERDVSALESGVRPSGEAACSLVASLPASSIPVAALRRLLDGAAARRASGRPATWEEWRQRELSLAEPIGEALARILGARQPASARRLCGLTLAVAASRLAEAPTAAIQRIPAEELELHGIAGRPRNGAGELRSALCERARRLFFQAEAADPGAERSLLFPAEVFARIAYERLGRIEASGGSLRPIGRGRKTWIAFSAWLKYRLLG